jgi:hypothetical protein
MCPDQLKKTPGSVPRKQQVTGLLFLTNNQDDGLCVRGTCADDDQFLDAFVEFVNQLSRAITEIFDVFFLSSAQIDDDRNQNRRLLTFSSGRRLYLRIVLLVKSSILSFTTICDRQLFRVATNLRDWRRIICCNGPRAVNVRNEEEIPL